MVKVISYTRFYGENGQLHGVLIFCQISVYAIGKKNSDQRNSLFVLKEKEKHSYFKERLRGEPPYLIHQAKLSGTSQ